MEVFWSDSIYVLYKNDKLKQFFPKKNMTLEERLNSIVRLSLYISVIVALYSKNYQYIYIFFIALILTYLIYKNRYNAYNDYFLDYTNNLVHKYIEPTKNNPFMNITLNDYNDNPNREALNKANSYINTDLNDNVTKKFNYNLYRDADDIYDRVTTQRQFYTMPITTIPNRQDSFSKWLYSTPPTCKENGTSCIKGNYEHLKDSKIRNGVY